MTRRSEFQAAAKGWRVHAPAFTLQARKRTEERDAPLARDAGSGEWAATDAPRPGPPRFGLTATRKIGGAVERNRIKRRLRAALRRPGAEIDETTGRGDRESAGGAFGRDGHDYVLVARREALAMPFEALRASVRDALRRIHAPRARARKSPSGETQGRDEAEGTSRNDT